MTSFYRDAIEEYKKHTSRDYDDSRYPDKDSIPSDLINLVSQVKMYFAQKEQIRIRNELLPHMKNGIFVAPPGKEYLIDDCNNFSRDEEFWAEIYEQS